MKHLKIFLIISSLLFCLSAIAKPMQFVLANRFIQNLQATLNQAKSANLTIIFPSIIPKDPSHRVYFANLDASNTGPNKGYLINIDYTVDCKGAHYCTVGYLRAEEGKSPEPLSDRDQKNITQKVTLAGKIVGYYTPGHAMGDYFSPQLQWKVRNVLYTLTWTDQLADKLALMAMANSTIEP